MTTPKTAPSQPPASLAALASQSADIEPQGKLSPERANTAKAIGAGLVEGLVTQATQAAKRALTPDVGKAWAGVLETLDALDLSPVISCAKTGREIYTLTPDHFPAHLAELSKLGDSAQADTIQGQLIRAIETQKAYTALPSVATVSAGNMAFLRDASPLDYALVSLQDAFPAPKKSQSGELALRAERLRLTRANLARLEPAALAYLCECLHLYLANIKPSSVAQNCMENTLAHYQGQGLDYITQTPAQIGHLCRRIIQLAFNLIAKHQPKKLEKLTTRDILNLRVHYQGLPQYKAQQADRRANDVVKRFEAAKQSANEKRLHAAPMLTEAMRGKLALIAGDDLESGLEGAVLDMVAAFATGLDRPLKVAAATPAQADKYRAIHAATQEEAPQPIDEIFGEAFAGDLDMSDLMPVIETEADLLLHGFAVEGELDLFLEELPEELDAQEEQTPEAAPDIFDTTPDFETPVSLAMKEARPALTKLALIKTLKPRDPIPPSPAPRPLLAPKFRPLLVASPLPIKKD